MTWNLVRKSENVKNEKCTLQDLDYSNKTHQKEKGETHILGPGIWRENQQMRKMRNWHGRI